MSPEQVEGKDIDLRSDIYSLGVILYEILTGRVPFEGETPFAVGVKHKSEIPKDPKALNTQIPDDLSGVILKCLEKEREKRYQNAAEVRSDLEEIEKGLPAVGKEVVKKKPITSKEITVTLGVRKLLIPAIAVMLLVTAALIIWQPWAKQKQIPLTKDKPALAVMYFKNNTGDEGLDFWRQALSDSIITDLSQSQYLTVLSSSRLFSILKKLGLQEETSYAAEDLEKVASEGGVDYILQGNLSKAGDAFRIEYTLQKIYTEEIIGSERFEGIGDQSIFAMVDELTKKVKSNFRLSAEEIARDIDNNIGSITTQFPEAYKNFIVGLRFHYSGDYNRALPSYQRAVSIDPEFGQAYRYLAWAYWQLGYASEFKKYQKKAFECRDRLPERERGIITADYYRETGHDYEKAIQALNELLEKYPDDFEGSNILGRVYVLNEQWNEAIRYARINVDLKRNNVWSFLYLSIAYRMSGLYDKARDVLETYIRLFGEQDRIRREMALLYVSLGEMDNALEEAEKAYALNPSDRRNSVTRGDVYLYREEYSEMRKEIQSLMERDEPDAQNYVTGGSWSLSLLHGKFQVAIDHIEKGLENPENLGDDWLLSFHRWLGYTYLRRGDYQYALEILDRGLSLSEELNSQNDQCKILHLKGVTLLKMGDESGAEKTAEILKKAADSGLNKKLIRLYHHLLGYIRLERGDPAVAIKLFENSIALLPSNTSSRRADFFEPLARAYYILGKLDDAAEVYDMITELKSGRFEYSDIYAQSFYMLGKISQQKGNTAQAIQQYNKFLSLWKDADPGVAEVEDAKKRLDSLKVK
jgi:tetratricopeptide (TPR) repeat protein